MALTAFSPPNRPLRWRYRAPRYESLRERDSAAMRKALATRFLTRRDLWAITFPPLMSRCGASPNQAVKCDSVGNALKSGPISDRITCAVMTLMPSIVSKSTPVVRRSSAAKSKLGAFLDLRFAFAFLWRGPASTATASEATRGAAGSSRVGRAVIIFLQLDVAGRDLALQKIVGVYNLLQLEQHLLPPVPFQAMSNLLLTGLHARVPQRRQLLRVS